jgi:hypothetical protein
VALSARLRVQVDHNDASRGPIPLLLNGARTGSPRPTPATAALSVRERQVLALIVEILIPGKGADRNWEGFGAVKQVYGETHEQGFAVQTVKVMVFGEGPRGQDTEGSG